jgi:hypothetical protein
MAYSQTPTKAEDVAAADGDLLVPIAVVRQDTLASSTNADGDYGTPKINSKGELYVKQTDPISTTTAADVAPATQNVTVVDSGSTSVVSSNGQALVTGSPTANSAASFAVASLETVRVQVTGTWTGSLQAEISVDGGTTWFAQGLHQGAYTTSTFLANFVGGGSITGATNFRLRATAAMTGTAIVKIIESINTNSVYIANAAPSGNVTSLLNSSVATLTTGSVFTGAGEDVSNFSEMRISVISNVASATDGLSIQQSTDNTNWDITDTYTITAATAKTFVVPRQARYFRIVYTNGGTNQTSFRLQTILNRTATAPSSQRASDGYTNETDLVQNQAFLMVYDSATGLWNRARQTSTGVQAVGVNDGTNTTNVLKSDGSSAGQNSLLVAGAVMTSGTLTLNAATPATAWYDMGNYAWVSVEILTNTTPVTLTFQTSGDAAQTNIRTMSMQDSQSTAAVLVTSTSSATATLHGPRTGRYFRILSNATAAQTATIVLTFYTNPSALQTLGVMAAQNGAWSVTTSAQIPGVGATNLGKAEDAAHVSGDTGVLELGVRNDGAAATLTSTDGDYGAHAIDSTGSTHVVQKAQTATLANVAGSATSVTLLAANNNRKGAQIYNDSTAVLYVKFGSTASTTSFTVLMVASAYYEVPAGYVGIITGVWASATGSARVTEET